MDNGFPLAHPRHQRRKKSQATWHGICSSEAWPQTALDSIPIYPIGWCLLQWEAAFEPIVKETRARSFVSGVSNIPRKLHVTCSYIIYSSSLTDPFSSSLTLLSSLDAGNFKRGVVYSISCIQLIDYHKFLILKVFSSSHTVTRNPSPKRGRSQSRHQIIPQLIINNLQTRQFFTKVNSISWADPNPSQWLPTAPPPVPRQSVNSVLGEQSTLPRKHHTSLNSNSLSSQLQPY